MKLKIHRCLPIPPKGHIVLKIGLAPIRSFELETLASSIGYYMITSLPPLEHISPPEILVSRF